MSRGWWRRARGSVRLRVTVLAAGAFAVVLALAAFILLRVLEDALVDDVQSANEAALEVQAARLIASGGVPDGSEMVLTSAGPAYALPPSGQREVVAFTPGASTTITESSLPPDIIFERTLPSASAEVLGVAGRADEFSVSSLRIGGVVLATATSLDNVRDTIDTTREAAVGARAGARRPRRRVGVAAGGSRPAPRPRRHVARRVDRLALTPRAGAGARLERRDRRVGDDDERHARAVGGGVDDEPASGVRRIPRAADAGRRDADRARGRPPRAGQRLGRDVGGVARRARPAAGSHRRPAAAGAWRRARLRPHAVLGRRCRP